MMNIFVLDENPTKAANYHCDKHVVKMILESTQLLTTAYYETNHSFSGFPRTDSENNPQPYKLTHKNHPCTKWAVMCLENWCWLLWLAISLCCEYEYRYKKEHKCFSILDWMSSHIPTLETRNSVTPFPLAMPDYCKLGDAVESYRNYYKKEKRNIAIWNYSKQPYWYN